MYIMTSTLDKKGQIEVRSVVYASKIITASAKRIMMNFYQNIRDKIEKKKLG